MHNLVLHKNWFGSTKESTPIWEFHFLLRKSIQIEREKKKKTLSKPILFFFINIQLNPQKEIPVLDDNGFLLGESVAIMQYLCDKYAPENPIYPKDPKTRALVNQRLCFNMAFYYSNISQYTVCTRNKQISYSEPSFLELLASFTSIWFISRAISRVFRLLEMSNSSNLWFIFQTLFLKLVGTDFLRLST